MGLLYADVRNLIEHFRSESEGKRVITLGRLSVRLHPNEIHRLKNLLSDDRDACAYLDTYQWGEYSERIFKELFKCATVESLDFSDYQGASIVQDIQVPVPEVHWEKYDLVFDGGTLEHVFNLPQALANIIRLAKVGGLVYTNSPSNNLSGHGFYQFSPELMYRVMSSDNGMSILMNRIGVADFPTIENSSCHPVYAVTDPAKVRCRVELQLSRPVYMMTLSRKLSAVPVFESPVLQSDYTIRWNSEDGPRKKSAKGKIFSRLPAPLQHLIVGYWHKRRSSLRNTQFYRRLW